MKREQLGLIVTMGIILWFIYTVTYCSGKEKLTLPQGVTIRCAVTSVKIIPPGNRHTLQLDTEYEYTLDCSEDRIHRTKSKVTVGDTLTFVIPK